MPLPPMSTGVDQTALATAKEDFPEFVGRFEIHLKKVNTDVQAIAATWSGNLYDKCQGFVTEWQQNMQKYNNGLMVVGESLGVVGINYEVLDDSVTGA